jgi:trehalose 6-phosphate synthase
MRIVPIWLREELLDGLLGADLLGFQTRRWADDFLFTARMLPEARVDLRTRTVEWHGRRTRVGVYPITVDVEPMREQARSEGVARKCEELEAWRGDRRMLLRVDRAELSKNVLRGFLTYEDLLNRHPEWRERVVFLAHLQPSRRSLEEYRAYTQECIDVAERINRELGTPGWERGQPTRSARPSRCRARSGGSGVAACAGPRAPARPRIGSESSCAT